MKALASVRELESDEFRLFMTLLNAFAKTQGLRVHTDWSKVWEYPWAWRTLGRQAWAGLRLVDIGSENSPMPWFLACLGADVTLVEIDRQWEPVWTRVREALGCRVSWVFSSDETIPLTDGAYDIVTSFSTIEHQPNKERALAEIRRLLRPNGVLVLSFDICEPEHGMSFPDWNGRALTMRDFDSLLWNAPGWRPLRSTDRWNVEDMPAFVSWHLQSAPHHRYVVGAAALRKLEPPRSVSAARHAFQLCTGLGAGNIGDEIMAKAFWDHLPQSVRLTVEVFPEYAQRPEPYPEAHEYVAVGSMARERQYSSALLAGGTPVMESWGLDWPLQFLSTRLSVLHERGLPVDAVGVGVDRIESKDARDLFTRHFLPIRSWTVRSQRCRAALLELGVPADRILVGADWAWLYRPRQDCREWGAAVLRELGLDPSRPLILANVVNEIWRSNEHHKRTLAAALDELGSRHGFQTAFFCNEVRPGDYYDREAASEVAALMRRPAPIVANLFYAPDQVLGLLSHTTLALSERYHFSVEAVLAESVPVNIVRGEKMASLVEDLGLEPAGTMDELDRDSLVEAALLAAQDRASHIVALRAARRQLEIRAGNNLAFFNIHVTRESQRDA